MRTKEELEDLINGSSLFSIDRIKDKELFVIEERKFLSDLVEFMALIRKDFTDIGSEIILTAKACIKAYKQEKGEFLNYFNHALKTALIKEKVKEAKLHENLVSGDAKIFDIIATTDDSPEDKVVSTDMARYIVRIVNFVFKIQQERTKALLSKLLTLKLLEALLFVYSEAEVLEELVFVDFGILSVYKNGGELPSARQIAVMYDTTEQQASRTINRFWEKLMKNDKFFESCAYMKIGGIN
jgi:hypothetical protein